MATLVIDANNSGTLNRYGAESYAACQGAAESTDATNAAAIYAGQYRDSYLGGWNDNSRGGVEFVLPSFSGETSATLSLYGGGDDSDTDFNVVLVSGADLGATLVVADWGDLLDETTSLGEMSTTTFILEDWNVITLNATGLALLVPNTTVRFGLRSSLDISATAPTGDPEYQTVAFYGSGAAGKKPKLTITYPFIPRIFIT